MHIDVNSAFLSWTAVDLLKKGYHDIRNVPSVIAGDETKRSGVVLSRSIPSKKYGVVSAETLYSARKKCRTLEIYPPNYSLYKEMSKKLFKLISKYTNDIEIVSIDECFMDYGKVKQLYGDEVKFAYKLKDEIYNTLGFTVNIGIANNKLCAKMASDFTKPNRVHTLYANEVKDKMLPLPIEDLYGVGKSSSAKLRNIGVNTIGDLALLDKDTLYPYFKNQSKRLIEIANGIDDSEVVSEISDKKSIGTSVTLLYDYDDIDKIYEELYKITDKVTNELKEKNKYTSVIAVVIRDKYFNTITRQKKLNNSTDSKKIIFDTCKKLFKDNWDETPVRLIGIRLDSLTSSNDYQISLFEDIEKKKKDESIDKVVENLRKKFGNNIIK